MIFEAQHLIVFDRIENKILIMFEKYEEKKETEKRKSKKQSKKERKMKKK